MKSLFTRSTIASIVLPLALLLTASFQAQASADSPANVMPEKIDPAARYLVYSHNAYVEKNGPGGATKHSEILKSFGDMGYTVISEVRSGRIIPCQYADKVVGRVEKLIEAGVAPNNITVAGHSKGAVISLCAATKLNNEKINFLIMAGCDIKPMIKYKLYPDFSTISGRMLSIYDSSDKVANSCSSMFSAESGKLKFNEIVVNTEKGHRLFFSPQDSWVTPVTRWLQEGS